MNVKTLRLAHLAKSQKGNAAQLAGDTSVDVPNTFLPVLQPPDIFTFFNTVAQAGLTTETHSFIQTDNRLFNVNLTVELCRAGPGLWEFEFAHSVVPEGAGNDNGSVSRLNIILIDGTNPTAELSRLANTQAISQQNRGTFKALLSSEQALAFQINTIIGAGTGTNRHHIRIIGNRML